MIKAFKRISGFTMVELIITIAILAILASATVIIFNPSEMVSEPRDSKRINDLNQVNTAINLSYNSGRLGGLSNIVYVSLPDSSASCSSYTLPSLPSPWTYRCASSSNYRKIDGTGWLPVNLNLILGGSTLSTLPIDPINDSKYYYAYVVNNGKWEVFSRIESKKYNLRSANDNGDNAFYYESGKSFFIAPNPALGISCKAIHDTYPNVATGIYWIDVDGGGANPTINVYCDMTLAGGGWTLVQNTVKNQPYDRRWSESFQNQLINTIGAPSIVAPYRLAMEYWYLIPNNSWAKVGITTAEEKETFNQSSPFSVTGLTQGGNKFTYSGVDTSYVLNTLSYGEWNACTNSLSYFNSQCCHTCILYTNSALNIFNQPASDKASVTALDKSPLQSWSNYIPFNRLSIFLR